MLIYISFLIFFLLRWHPAHCVSTVQFFSDKTCHAPIGQINGTDDGSCHGTVRPDASAQLVALDPHCAATIYSDPFCSNSPTIANLNSCMSGSIVVGSFRIDCQAAAPSTAAFTAAAGKPSSTSPALTTATAGQKTSLSRSSINLSPATLAAIVAAGAVAVISILVAFAIWRCQSKRRQRRQAPLPALKLSNGYDAESLKAAISAPRRDEGFLGSTERRSATTVPFFMAAPKLPPPSQIPSKAASRHDPERNPLVSPLTPGLAYMAATNASGAAPPSQIADRGTVPSSARQPSENGAWWQKAKEISSTQTRRQGTLTLFPPKSPYERMV